jgi:hypothetical protein
VGQRHEAETRLVSDLVDALMAPLQPTVDLRRALVGGVTPADGIREGGVALGTVEDDLAGGEGGSLHGVHGVALLPTVADPASLLETSVGSTLTDVLRRGLLPAVLPMYRDRLLRLLKALVRESMEAVLVAFTVRAREGNTHTAGRTASAAGQRPDARVCAGDADGQRGWSRRRRPSRARPWRSSCGT